MSTLIVLFGRTFHTRSNCLNSQSIVVIRRHINITLVRRIWHFLFPYLMAAKAVCPPHRCVPALITLHLLQLLLSDYSCMSLALGSSLQRSGKLSPPSRRLHWHCSLFRGRLLANCSLLVHHAAMTGFCRCVLNNSSRYGRILGAPAHAQKCTKSVKFIS